MGGVSNMEYGWNRVIDPVTRARSMSEDDYSIRDNDNQSVRSGRSRFKDMASTVRADKSPWADRTFINDWKPPLPPSVPSMHDEETQLEALQKHVLHLKEELQQHNELRTPMTELVSLPRISASWPMTFVRFTDRFSHIMPVSTSFVQPAESADELGEEVAVSADRDRQVRVVHRLSAARDVAPDEEARREGAGEGAGRVFLQPR